MRKITLVIASVVGMISLSAQNPQLLDNSWYLQKLVIDGIDHFPPSNSEVTYVSLDFFQTHMESSVCNDYGSSVLEYTNNDFTLDQIIILTQNCVLPETIAFEIIYSEDFWLWTQQGNVYDYLIEQGTGSSKVLTITNSNGDLAIYGGEILLIEDSLLSEITVYPNPTTDLLKIQIPNELDVLNVWTMDLSGRIHLSNNYESSELDISSLASGVYILTINTNVGSRSFHIVRN